MKKNQHGQALVEFVYLSLAMVPLFILLPMIGKYQDISHATQMASRYVAFDAITNNSESPSGWKSHQELTQDVRKRFFSTSLAAIKTNDAAHNTGRADKNPLWTTPFDQPLIPDMSDITVSFGSGATVSTQNEGGFVPTAGNGRRDSDVFNQYGFGNLAKTMRLPANGLYQANVTVPLANLPAGLNMVNPFNAINLSMTRSTVILFDGWAANSPSQVQDRAKRIAIVGEALENLEPAIDALVWITEDMGKIPGPRFNRLQRWQDVVPADRLSSK
jgi:hypothetical protein